MAKNKGKEQNITQININNENRKNILQQYKQQ